MAITISTEAAEKLKAAIPPEKAAEGAVLRIVVQGGGCAGLSYKMDFDRARERDKVFEASGVKVVVDPKSYFYVNGSELTYKVALTGSGFTLVNPNVKGTCGCGVSFQV